MAGRRVEVVHPNSGWPEDFRREAERLGENWPTLLLYLHHIGSTAVPGLQAKPIIDMLAVVPDVCAMDRHAPALEHLGYRELGEHGISGRRFYQKGGIQPTHHLHVYPPGHPEVARHLAFRDYLRAFLRERDAYGLLKERLAAKFPEDIDHYMDGKTGWIRAAVRRAEEWWATVPMVIITGPVGIGKTTVAEALATQLESCNVAYWVMDIDRLTDFAPRSPGDRFGFGMSTAGIASLWPVMRSAGVRVVIFPRVVESPWEVERLRNSIPGATALVVRLRASLETLESRIRGRSLGPQQAFDLQRTRELLPLMEATHPSDVVVDTEGRRPEAVAKDIQAVLRRRFWIA